MHADKFRDWLKRHPCNVDELWKVQNCIGTVFGFDHPAAQAAAEAWRDAPESAPSYSQAISKQDIPDQEFHGETFDEKRDGKRLRKLQELVEECMADGQWRSIPQIRKAIGRGTETSISARLRDA